MMEVMLMADVKKLGKSGAIVKVAPGYARNYLFTQGLAAPVTEASKRRLAKLEAERAKERAARKAAAEELAKKMAGLNVTVSARTVDGKRLYGSVSATDIIGAITPTAAWRSSVRSSIFPTSSRRLASTTPSSIWARASSCPSR